jgi:pimeloyl-ACP methyl ester carboxylesterase
LLTGQDAAMHRSGGHRWIVGLVTAVLALAGSADGAVADTFGRCRDGSFVDRCAQVRVPLDRSGGVPGFVDLDVRIEDRSRLGPHRRSGDRVVLALVGGAAEPATGLLTDVASDLTELLDPLVGGGRLLAFDRRGTGGSDPIGCRAVTPGRPITPSAPAACAAELGTARAFYTTHDSVEDVEAVRAAVGVERLTIYGVGEGARLAVAYAAAHAEHVERLVLDSPVPVDGADPFRRSAFSALPGFIRTALCLRACHFTRDPYAELRRLVGRATVSPLAGTVIDGHGRPHPQPIAPADLAALLVGSDAYGMAANLPGFVHGALGGDLAPLARAVSTAGPTESRLHDAASLVAACEDSRLPWAAGTPPAQRSAALEAALARLPADAYAPFATDVLHALGTADLCLDWPVSGIAPTPLATLPRVPTLILSGAWDITTPPADAAALARAIPAAQLLRVPGVGHGVLALSEPLPAADPLAGCAPRALAAFVHSERIARCPRRTTLFDGHPRPLRGAAWWTQLLPASFAAVRPASARVPLRVGRTLAAVRLTMYDFIQQAILGPQGDTSLAGTLRFGGLRGGWALLDRRNWRLHDYETVPGVTLSLTFRPRPRLRIGGSAAVHGVLTRIAGCGESACFAGRLGGWPVHVIIPGSA